MNLDIETLTCSATEITGAGAFFECCTDTSSLTSVSFPNLTKVGTSDHQSVFYQAFRATGLKKIEFPELVYLYGRTSFNYLCYNCKSLEEARFPKLKQISQVSEFQVMQAAFSGCDKLTTVDFSSLEYIKGASDLGYCFSDCTSLSTLSFPSFKATGSRTDAFSSMLNGVTGCTVHFPSNQQSAMGSWSDVTAGFGGTNTTVLFDLTATE